MASVEGAAPPAQGATHPPPGLKHLEVHLSEAFLAIVRAYGASTAIQSVGRLLSMPLPLPQLVTDLPSDASGAASPSPSELGSARNSMDLAAVEGQHAAEGAQSAHKARPANKWKRAILAAQNAADPWAGRQLHLLPMEHCVRLRYNPLTQEWVTDDVIVKVESKPFAAGAMRECYAMKKLSTFTTSVVHDWTNPRQATNCVAKRYKKDIKKKIYFIDCLVQMDAKSLGDEYNKTHPPKKVDVLQVSVLQFCDRPGAPLYCVEQLIEGDYIKYNSNSGFVHGDNDVVRNTPQAFSHYTFELTQGRKICVDVQGVGDLYTDPQIHTMDGQGYGEGNLGLRGMALFFRTHECNELCARLKLKPFARCETDVKAQGYASDSSLSSNFSGGGATMSRTLMRRASYQQRHFGTRKWKRGGTHATSKADLLEALREVPMVAAPSALVHLEVCKVYAEVVLLPELRPQESPEDALQGALFHLNVAACQGSTIALCMLARIHWGLEPTSTQFAHLTKVAKQSGSLEPYPDLAFRYATLAAERGVAAACAAVAHSYATGQGLGEHVLEEAQPAKAVTWYTKVLEIMKDPLPQDEDMGAANADSSDYGEPDPRGKASVLALARSLSFASHGTRSEAQRQNSLASEASEAGGAVQGTEAVPLSRDFVESLRVAAEEEAMGLPGATVQRYEILAHLGTLMMEGGEGLTPDYRAATDYFTSAAEEAEAALKPKLSMKYYDLASQAEGMVEEEAEPDA